MKELIVNYKKLNTKRFSIVKRQAQKADFIIIIWDGICEISQYIIDNALVSGKKVRVVLMDSAGVPIFPGNCGDECEGNGKNSKHGYKIICCDECDYLMCCMDESRLDRCTDCKQKYCPRKYQC